MTPDQILKLLSLGEGQRVEFKATAANVETLGRVVCGFLNTSGGYLICGVGDRGAIRGVDASADAVAALEKKLHDGLSPKALVSVEVQWLEKKPVIVIEVPADKDVPYAFRDAIYLRSAESTQRANAETIRDIVMRRQIEPERWERRFSFADLENDVDLEEVRSAIVEAQAVRRAFFRDATNPMMVLEDFSASKYGRLTNGGDVLFTRNPAARLPQTRIRAMRYNSDKAGDKFDDLKSFEGPLHQLFEDAYSFIVRNTASVARFIKGDPKRKDSPVYPEEAVREGLINALAHRDYTSASGGISVHIFPRRLEIWNSGGLPDGVTEESLAKGNISVLRNPDIAHVLYLRGLMEKAGRGSVLILRACENQGLPPPTWTSDEKKGVTLTFFTSQVTPQVTPQGTPQVEKLLAALKGAMSRGDLMAAVGIKDREHFRQAFLQPALENKLIARTEGAVNSSLQRYRLTPLGQAARTRRR